MNPYPSHIDGFCKMLLKESEWARELKEVTVNLFPLLYVAKEKKKKVGMKKKRKGAREQVWKLLLQG